MSANSEGRRGAVCAVGMFDGVHLGHRHLLERLADTARETGREAVAVTFDVHPLSLVRPGSEPQALCSLGRRVELIRSCGVSEVHVLHFDPALRVLTASEFIGLLRRDYGVDMLLMGYDHGFGSDRLSALADYREAGRVHGVSVDRVGEYTLEGCGKVSSSSVRRALDTGDVELAARMLGRSYEIEGTVVHGRRLGHTIGFPTANVEPSGHVLVPARGVYAGYVLVDGSCYPAMVNIGHNPTVSDTPAPMSIEAHIIDFDGDIYGHTVRLGFVRRLRDERRFDSVEALSSALADDRRATISILAGRI